VYVTTVMDTDRGGIIDKSVHRFSIENKSFLASAWSLAGTERKLSAIVNNALASGELRQPAQLIG